MATTTNYGWTTPDDTALVKDGASAIRTLGSSIDTTLKAQIDAQIPDTLLTTTGDVIYASAANTPARLGIGSTGNVLTVSGGVPTWSAPASGSLTLISETTASALSSLSLSSIPSTYKNLLVRWTGINTSDNATSFSWRINSDSGSNYMTNRTNFTASAVQTITQAGTNIGDGSGLVRGATNAAANYAASGYLLIDNYASTSKTKYFEIDNNYYNVLSSEGSRVLSIGYWNSTSAVTSLDVFRNGGTGTFSNATNTSIRLYGVN